MVITVWFEYACRFVLPSFVWCKKAVGRRLGRRHVWGLVYMSMQCDPGSDEDNDE